MSLVKLNDSLIDLKKVSYIGPVDTKVFAHLDKTMHVFLMVVDGHPVETMVRTKEEILKLREEVVEALTGTPGLLPG